MKQKDSISVETRSVIIQMAGALHRIDMDSIIHLSSSGAYTLIELQRCTTPVHVGKNLGRFENKLITFGFVRIHKSHLVNPNRVEKFTHTKGGGGIVLLTSGTELPVSRSQKTLFLKAFKELATVII